MNCIKPSGPYIAFLAIVLIISFVGIPHGGNKSNAQTDNIVKEEVGGERLEQGDNLTMLNIDRHE